MKAVYIINNHILTDSNGEWWETIKTDGTSRTWAGQTHLRDKTFKTKEAAKSYAEHLKLSRFTIQYLTPPVKPSITWGQEIVFSS